MMIPSQGYFTHSFTYVSGSIATGGDVGMQVVIMVETPHWDVSTYLHRDIVIRATLTIAFQHLFHGITGIHNLVYQRADRPFGRILFSLYIEIVN